MSNLDHNAKFCDANFTLIVATDIPNKVLLKPFFCLLHENWPSFNSPAILSANVSGNLPFGVQRIHHSKHASWSTRLIRAVKKAKTRIVLLMLDDFYLTEPVDESFLEQAELIISNDRKVKCIRLSEYTASNDFVTHKYNDYFDVLDPDWEWSCSAQASFWDKNYLLRLLRHGESAWVFEMNGSIRQKHYRGLTLIRQSSYAAAFDYHLGSVVKQGKLSREAYVQSLILRFPELLEFKGTPPTVCSKKRTKFHRWFIRKYHALYCRMHVRMRFLPFWNEKA